MGAAPAHPGHVAAEIAVCAKTAGLVQRTSLRQLAVTGPEPLLDHVLQAALPDAAPAPGRAVRVASTWCCRTTARRALVAGAPAAVARWRQVESRVVSSAGLDVRGDLLADAAALTLVGPRALRIAAAAGLPAEMPLGGVWDGELGGSRLSVVREGHDSLLLLFERGYGPAALECLWAAGRDHGLAPVGNEALELLHAAHHPLG
jgi:glycine cleavage system aminomethyltransferase T